MAYKIHYDPSLKLKYPAKRKNQPIRRYISAFALLAVIMTLLYHPGVRQRIKNFLIPGDPEVTLSAGRELVYDIKAGNTVRESVMAFCKEILDGAQP